LTDLRLRGRSVLRPLDYENPSTTPGRFKKFFAGYQVQRSNGPELSYEVQVDSFVPGQ
jgi:hypothetical protein